MVHMRIDWTYLLGVWQFVGLMKADKSQILHVRVWLRAGSEDIRRSENKSNLELCCALICVYLLLYKHLVRFVPCYTRMRQLLILWVMSQFNFVILTGNQLVKSLVIALTALGICSQDLQWWARCLKLCECQSGKFGHSLFILPRQHMVNVKGLNW